jgi:hypothetical protein
MKKIKNGINPGRIQSGDEIGRIDFIGFAGKHRYMLTGIQDDCKAENNDQI